MNELTSLYELFNATPSKMATQLYLDIDHFSRLI